MEQSTLPTWIQWATDISQIVIAFGTLSAVWVAIWLALRSERPRLKFFFGINTHLNIGNSKASKGPQRTDTLSIDIVNTGVPPIHIRGLIACFPQSQGHVTQCAVEIRNGKISWESPCRLERGQSVTGFVGITSNLTIWRNLRPSVWPWNRPYFNIHTTFGNVYRARLNRKFLRHLQREAVESASRPEYGGLDAT